MPSNQQLNLWEIDHARIEKDQEDLFTWIDLTETDWRLANVVLHLNGRTVVAESPNVLLGGVAKWTLLYPKPTV